MIPTACTSLVRMGEGLRYAGMSVQSFLPVAMMYGKIMKQVKNSLSRKIKYKRIREGTRRIFIEASHTAGRRLVILKRHVLMTYDVKNNHGKSMVIWKDVDTGEEFEVSNGV